MAQSIDWESTVQAVVRSAVPAVADWTSLTMLEPTGKLRIVAVSHRDPERERLAWQLITRHPPDPDAESGAANVIRTGELEIVEDLSQEVIEAAAEDAEHLRLLENLNVRHYVIAPLKAPDGVIGVLTFVLGDSGRRFEPSDMQLITSLAARAALHIQNSRLYTERLRIAEVLQVGLRPRALPTIPGVELAARFRPAADELEVGGDFYDVFPADDGTWTLIIGDVSGKGAEAAAVTALARHTLRAASLLLFDPAAELALLNRALVADATEHFCTVFCARVRHEAGGLHCRFANGGHLPPLLLRRDGTLEEVEGGRGPLVGPFGDAQYEEATLRLEPGDLLLMYTDGVTEVRRSADARGERNLRATLAASIGRSAEEVVGAVERKAVELLAGRARDDMALLAIKAEPAPVEDN
ncbi:MAG: SpoIIE family protein phosphatase [Actinomycetota bacterium]|nr:SpoIIE family protein phosphatase [Actinomycetota bacterium]